MLWNSSAISVKTCQNNQVEELMATKKNGFQATGPRFSTTNVSSDSHVFASQDDKTDEPLEVETRKSIV